MKKIGKLLVWMFVALAVVLAAGITFTIGWRPFVGPHAWALTARKFESTPTRLARGEYLTRNVITCMDCHAEHDWTAHDAPVLQNTLGAGQDMSILKGLPGKGVCTEYHSRSGNGRGKLERRSTGAGHPRRCRSRWAGAVSFHAIHGFPGRVR